MENDLFSHFYLYPFLYSDSECHHSISFTPICLSNSFNVQLLLFGLPKLIDDCAIFSLSFRWPRNNGLSSSSCRSEWKFSSFWPNFEKTESISFEFSLIELKCRDASGDQGQYVRSVYRCERDKSILIFYAMLSSIIAHSRRHSLAVSSLPVAAFPFKATCIIREMCWRTANGLSQAHKQDLNCIIVKI